MDRDEMSNLYRGPSIVASYQVSVHLAKRFQRRRFFQNRPIRNKNCLWRPCLLMDQDEMSNLYRGPSIDASYQVSVHIVEGFQRRRLKCEKLADDRRRTPSDGKSSPSLWQDELKKLLICCATRLVILKLVANTGISFFFQISEMQFVRTMGKKRGGHFKQKVSKEMIAVF